MKIKKTFLYLVLFSLFFSAAYCEFYPVGEGYVWKYSGYMKNEPQKKIDVSATIISKQKISGKEYYYYSAPSVDVRFMVRTDPGGGYMKLVKYPFPVLKFLTVDVLLTPEIQFMKFPFNVGDSWSREVKAEADLVPFKLNRKIKIKFTTVAKEIFRYKEADYECYHVRMERDDGGSVRIEDNWFANGLGFVRGETPEYYIELYDFSGAVERTDTK
jgi:hypothetical protein